MSPATVSTSCAILPALLLLLIMLLALLLWLLVLLLVVLRMGRQGLAAVVAPLLSWLAVAPGGAGSRGAMCDGKCVIAERCFIQNPVMQVLGPWGGPGAGQAHGPCFIKAGHPNSALLC